MARLHTYPPIARDVAPPRAPSRLSFLGDRLGVDVPPPEGQAVDLPARRYMASVASDVRATLAKTLDAFSKYRNVRDRLGLPLVGGNGLSADEFDRMARLERQGRLLLSGLDGAASGTRRVAIHDGDFWIEGFATDTGRLIVSGAVTSIIEQSGVSGPRPNSLGEPVSIGAVAVIVAATAITALAAYFAWKAAMSALQTVIEQKTARSIADRAFDCVESGKCTPKDAQNLASGTLTAAAQLAAARTTAESKDESGLGPTVKTVAWVALGLGALYVIAQLVPAFTSSRSSQRLLPA